MDLISGIKSRRSYRAFTDKAVTKADLLKVLEAAENCSSYTNTQPWELACVTGQKKAALAEMLLGLAERKNPLTPDIPKPESWPPQMEERMREHGKLRLETLGVAREDQKSREKLRLLNYEFYAAPCAVFLFMDRSLGEWSIFDLGLFAQNFILAAHAFDLGCCIQASAVDYAEEIKKFLGVGDKKLIVGIAMGYPDPDNRLNLYRSVKKKPEDFLHWYE